MSLPEIISEREAPDLRELPEVPALAGEKLTGYAIVFNQRSRVIRDHHGVYTEVIEPGAFDTSKRNVTFVFKHDDDAEYGDTQSGTLKLDQDERGIRFELAVPPYAHSLRQRIGSGAVKGMSFAFHARDVEWKDGVRHVRKGELLHVSPVYSPAYPQTSVTLAKPLTNDTKRKRLELASKI